jgi:hypothetical protein
MAFPPFLFDLALISSIWAATLAKASRAAQGVTATRALTNGLRNELRNQGARDGGPCRLNRHRDDDEDRGAEDAA